MDLKASVGPDPDPLRVKRKTIEAVLLQCQRALELINATSPSASVSASVSASAEVEEEDCETDGEAEATASTDPHADQVVPLSLLGFRFVRNFYALIVQYDRAYQYHYSAVDRIHDKKTC